MIEQRIKLRKQTNAFAMQSGMIFGTFWCISFLLLVSRFTPLKATFPLFLVATPFIGFYLASKFRRDVQKDGSITYARGFWFSLQLYLYATAILAIVVYIYFHFFDNGVFIQSYLESLSQPDVRAIFKAQGIQIQELEEAFKNINAVAMTASIINFNAIIAIPMALLTAFFAITPSKKL